MIDDIPTSCVFQICAMIFYYFYSDAVLYPSLYMNYHWRTPDMPYLIIQYKLKY